MEGVKIFTSTYEFLREYDKEGGGDYPPIQKYLMEHQRSDIRALCQPLIEEHMARITNSDLKGMSKKDQDLCQGTYSGDVVLIQALQACKPAFRLKVSKIVKAHFDKERKEVLAMKDKIICVLHV